MNVQEAIAYCNKLLEGTDQENYFSPKQPEFFIEAARSSISTPAPTDYTEADCKKIVDDTLAYLKGLDDEVKRDYDMTAKTTREGRVIVNQLLTDVSLAYEKKYGSLPKANLDRPLFWGLAEDNGVTIYTERWHGSRDGDNFILPKDRATMFNALLKYAVDNEND